MQIAPVKRIWPTDAAPKPTGNIELGQFVKVMVKIPGATGFDSVRVHSDQKTTSGFREGCNGD